MSYILPLLMIFLFMVPLKANEFERLNPRLTKEMKEAQAHAKPCASPAVAQEKFGDGFRYGCFCGKGFPAIEHPSKKHYTKLNRTEAEALITQYYEVEPYDSIDEVCMQHDICYIYRGGPDESCNDAIYDELRNVEDAFFQVRYEKKEHKKEDQCRALASDIGSVFKTVFVESSDNSLFGFGFKMMTTPITVASKGVQKTARGMNSDSTYPLKGEKCLLSDLNVSDEK